MSLEYDVSDVLLFENGISNIVMVQLSRALDIMFGAILEKMPKFTQKNINQDKENLSLREFPGLKSASRKPP